MSSKKPRKYCSVFGCLNTNSSNPELSFFQMPTEPDIRLKWLQIIDREDLANTPSPHAVVCQAHFKAEDVSVNPSRKVLRKNRYPSLYLPNRDPITTVSTTTQTELPICVACETMKINSSIKNESEEVDETAVSNDQMLDVAIKNESEEVDETAVSNVQMQADAAEGNRSPNAYTFYERKKEDTSKTSNSGVNKDPEICLCGTVLDTMMENKLEKDNKSYKNRIVIKNRKINNLQKANERLRRRNIVLKNALNLIKKKKYLEPSVLQELSLHVMEEPIAEVDLLDVKEEKIQYIDPLPTRDAEKDPAQVQAYGHNFIEDPIPIKLEVIDDSENCPEDKSVFSAENTASHTDNQNMITFNVPLIDHSMEVEDESNLLNKLKNVLDEYDKWALKISKQIKTMTNVDERINAMNATQNLVDAYVAKDANSKSDESNRRMLLKPNKMTFASSMLPVMGGILLPEQGTSREAMAPKAIQIQPITLPNVIQSQKEKK